MIRSTRESVLLRAAFAIGLVTILGSSAVAMASTTPHVTRTTAHGEGFLLKPVVNTYDCVDVTPGGTQGRPLSLSSCSQNATERWTLTLNADGTNLLVDSMGMCVDAAGRKAGDGIALKVVDCSFAKSQRLRYTSVGRLQFSGTSNCLSIPAAHVAAAVFLTPCNSASPLQQFKLSL